MKQYVKPIIDINKDVNEGIYMASGSTLPSCDSKYMNGEYIHYNGGWNVSVKTYYGCVGCPAYRETGCGLLVDQAYLDGATSYNVDNGNRMPEWERKGFTPDYIVNDENGLPY